MILLSNLVKAYQVIRKHYGSDLTFPSSLPSAIMRVGRERCALVDGLLVVGAWRGSGDPTNADASEAGGTQVQQQRQTNATTVCDTAVWFTYVSVSRTCRVFVVLAIPYMCCTLRPPSAALSNRSPPYQVQQYILLIYTPYEVRV